MTGSSEKKLLITAIVSSCNEAHLLRECLNSISECAEIIVVDQQSTDNTKEVANLYRTKYFLHERVNCIEKIRFIYSKKATHSWLWFIDPDEVADPTLIKSLSEFFLEKLNSNIGSISIPYRYYFNRYKLKGTIWGGNRYFERIIHKDRADILSDVHSGFVVKDNFEKIKINLNKKGTNIIHHYWMNDQTLFKAKHTRYLIEEGQRMFNLRKKYNVFSHLWQPTRAFTLSYFFKKGYLDGLLGLNLSIFYAKYIYQSWSSLKHYEKNVYNN